MSEDMPAGAQDELVYMLTGIDENGDTHIFVTSNLERAKLRHATVLDRYTEVKANWLEDISQRSKRHSSASSRFLLTARDYEYRSHSTHLKARVARH